jgi:[ribosomal protein S5]-alanine N-acetyltransferase
MDRAHIDAENTIHYDHAMTRLVTPRLILRRARTSDVDDLHRVFSDADAMRYWSRGPHAEKAETEAWIDAMIQARPEESDDFIIEHAGRAIGKLGAWKLPEIGFILSSDFWNQGLASEALGAFVTHVFARPDVVKLTADVDPRNKASLALLKRHGFRETGYGHGTWHTHIGVCDSVYLERQHSVA